MSKLEIGGKAIVIYSHFGNEGKIVEVIEYDPADGMWLCKSLGGYLNGSIKWAYMECWFESNELKPLQKLGMGESTEDHAPIKDKLPA